jgi:non-specific serine/threonine protein kinase
MREVGYALALSARWSLAAGDVAGAERLLGEAVPVLRRAGDRDALRAGLQVSARLAAARGQRQAARALRAEVAALAQELRPAFAAHALTVIGDVERDVGDLAAAAARHREAIAAASAVGQRAWVAQAVLNLAGLAVEWGEHDAAARLFGAVHSSVPDGADFRRAVTWVFDTAAARDALGEAAFAAAWAEGERMSLDEAVTYAQSLEPPPAPAPGDRSSPLTPREQEVAALIAEGKSNREIADVLVIAEPTAERHVANILNKLGVRSRAQVAAWQARRGTGV